MAEADEQPLAERFPGAHRVRISKGERDPGLCHSDAYRFEIDGKKIYPTSVRMDFEIGEIPQVTMTIPAIIENADLLAELAATVVNPRPDATPPKACDNTSVGVLIHNKRDQWLVFDRNTYPPGTAPAAGHVDHHGAPAEAAIAEVQEETGLAVVTLELLTGGWRDNACRRDPGPDGTGHHWLVYTATVTGELNPSSRETRNARWLAEGDLQQLADRTVGWARSLITAQEFAEAPGIEPVWVRWFVHTNLVRISADDLDSIDTLISSLRPGAQ